MKKKMLSMVYVVFRDDKEAQKIARRLLDEDLIVCANILPRVKSLYRWKGKVESSRETAVFFKAAAHQVKQITKRIEQLHSYETPVVAELPLNSVNTKYLNYVFPA